MKLHVLRPLVTVIGIVSIILVARALVVPDDFGVHERGYMYGWHRKGNEEDWKKFKIKYRGAEYCGNCHEEKYQTIQRSPHAIITCENCHGPAIDHPSEDRPKLDINKKREHCLRCHTYLNYPTSDRRLIRGIDPEGHNPGIECVMCHNPHSPGLGRAK